MKSFSVAWPWMIVLGLLTVAGTARAAAPDKILFEEEIRAQFAAGNPRVPVIVTLVPPPRAQQRTDWNDPASVASLRAANHARAAAVLQALPARQHKVRHRFDNLAGFSCEITEAALDQLRRHPLVAAIEPVRALEPLLNQGIPLMNALATRGTYDGTNLAIAIVDTGVDYTHPRLGGGGFPNSKVLGGYDFGNNDTNPIPVGQAHGTACAGIAAGNLGTVGDYIGGVAPGAKLYALKISQDNSGSASSDAMIAAWDWCVTHKNDNPAFPILVISTSFGGGRYFSACDSVSPAMTAAANNAVAAGITVLAAAGNDGYCDSMAWPACISNVISVGAAYDANFGTYTPCVSAASCATKIPTGGCSSGYYVNDSTAADKVTAYSNTANFLDLFAPANQCYTLDIVGSSGYSSGDYATSFGGTSAACPYAAGAVAVLQHAAHTLTGDYLTPAQVRAHLIATGNPLTDSKVPITKPRVNVGNAIAALNQPILQAASLTINGENCSPGNNAADPGETVTVALALRNTGAAAASNVVATLLATNGVVAPDAPQAYGIIPGGGAVVTQNFTFTVAGACGATIQPTFQLHTNSVLYGTLTHPLPLGAPGPTITTNNFSTGNLSLAINDNATTTASLTLTTTGIVADVNVRVRLNHTWDGDLTLALVHPDGTIVVLAYQRGGSGNNFGSGAANCSGTPTLFDDAAATAISNGVAPFAGAYRPDQPLAALNGKPTEGTWRLWVADGYTGDTGTLYCFQLELAYQTRECCEPPPDLALTHTNAPDPVTVGTPVTHALVVTNLTGVAAPAVTVTSVLPDTVTFLSASSGCVTGPGAVVICDLGTLTGLAGTNLTFTVTPNLPGLLLHTSVVATVAGEVNLLDNLAIATNTVTEAPPSLTGDPASQTICAGNPANFTVTASGSNLAYQWQKDAADLSDTGAYSGTTSNVLTIAPVDATHAGDYRCIVSNSGGSVTSAVATLTVEWPALVVLPATQSVGYIPTGVVVETSFVVSNAGCGTLTGHLDVGGSFTVAGQTATQMPVSVVTGAEGVFTNWVVFSSDAGVSTNAVTGSGAIAPVAAFVASVTNGAAPLEVEFTDLSTGTITNRLWHFGEVTSNVVATTVTREFTGTQEVLLVVSGPLGASTSAVVTVTATNVIPTADLAIGQSASAPTITLGDPVTLWLVVSNLGSATATSVTVTDTLPAQVTLLSAPPECVTNEVGLVCDFGTLPAAAATNISLVVLPLVPGSYTNLAAVTGIEADPDAGNNVAEATWVVPVDADGDGLPDAWELAHGLDPHDANDAELDNDGDGFNSRQEWWAGSDPADAQSQLRITGLEREGDDLRIFWQTAGGRTNVVEATGVLTNGFEVISPWLVIEGAGATVTNYLDAGGWTNEPLRVYRIRLVP